MKNIITELLTKNNLKPSQLAEALNVSTGNVADWQSGRSKPSVEALIKIADYFQISLDVLVGRTAPKDIFSQEFREAYMQLNDLNKKNLLSAVNSLLKTQETQTKV